MGSKIAIIADGGFIRKRLKAKLRHYPMARDIEKHCHELLNDPRFKNDILFRIYYYDALPFQGNVTNPIDGSVLNLSTTSQASDSQKLIDSLKLKEDFAVRLGSLINTGWKIGNAHSRQLRRTTNPTRISIPIAPRDLVPDLEQKGVDMKIGLDVALLAIKRLVEKVILITGDSDFIPVMKLARREGLKVYLNPMQASVKVTLKEHADGIIDQRPFQKKKQIP